MYILQFPHREPRRIGQQVPVVYRNQQDSSLRSLGVGAGGDQETLPLSLTSPFSSYIRGCIHFGQANRLWLSVAEVEHSSHIFYVFYVYMETLG